MKYIKEYSEYLPDQFTPEEIEDIKSVYLDMVDELDLYDNPFQILKVNDSTFQLPKRKEFKEIEIFIRTIVSEWIGTYDLSEPSNEEMDKHNHMLQLLEPNITRMRNMGYIVKVKDMLVGNPPALSSTIRAVGPKGMVVNGIEIHITKNN